MPSEKRQRQRARRQSMAQLRYQQQRRRRRRLTLAGLVAIAVVAAGVAVGASLLASGGKKTVKSAAGGTSTTTATSTPTSTTTVPKTSPVSVPLIEAPAGVGCPKLDGSSPHYTKFHAAPPTCIDPSKTYTATMVTTAGTITIHLLPKVAPVTVNNFVFLAGYHFYDGTWFHRIIPGFVDQGGDPKGTGTGGPGYTFKDELPKSPSVYTDGALAMANSGPDTNGSQFFLVASNNGAKQLQPSYSYFGKVTSGLSVVAKINSYGTASGTPTKVVKITRISISAS